jgi:hypothetical protein
MNADGRTSRLKKNKMGTARRPCLCANLRHLRQNSFPSVIPVAKVCHSSFELRHSPFITLAHTTNAPPHFLVTSSKQSGLTTTLCDIFGKNREKRRYSRDTFEKLRTYEEPTS